MATTVQQIIGETRAHFDTFDDQRALIWIQGIHNQILSLCRVKPDETVDIPLVVGTYQYALDPLVMKIWDARYLQTSTLDSRPLYARAVDEMDFQTKGQWRYMPNGTPIWYDERAGQLILHPTPDTATSGSYPAIRLTVQKSDTLDYTTTLPTAVPNYDAWIFGLGMRYAKEKGNVRSMMRAGSKQPITFSPAQTFEYLFKSALGELVAWTEGKSARERPNIQANVPRPQIS